MSTDMFILQPALRFPATGFQSDKIGSFGLNQSSKTKISRDSVKGGHDNFLNTLKQVTLGRVSNKRLKSDPDESSPVTGAPFDVRDMDEASPYQIASVWKFMAVIEVLGNLGFHDATGGSDLQRMVYGNHLDGKQAAPVKMLAARLRSENRKNADPAKQAADPRPVISENHQSPKATNIFESADATANKTEAGNNDSGLLNSSGQQSEKTVGFSPAPNKTESGQRILRNQTMDQIIRKAAIHLRNGQHEAIIDLKSDFLGHIRMQVIFENQQVAVRILVEHAIVKDMIENNLHQLKADLQQHGLEVDKLEVTVSCDPVGSGSSKEKFAQWRAGPGNVDHQKNDSWKDKQQIDTRQPPRKADNSAAVDYFA